MRPSTPGEPDGLAASVSRPQEIRCRCGKLLVELAAGWVFEVEFYDVRPLRPAGALLKCKCHSYVDLVIVRIQAA